MATAVKMFTHVRTVETNGKFDRKGRLKNSDKLIFDFDRFKVEDTKITTISISMVSIANTKSASTVKHSRAGKKTVINSQKIANLLK